MKTYTKPEVEVMELKSSDFITVSGLATSAAKNQTQKTFTELNGTTINFK